MVLRLVALVLVASTIVLSGCMTEQEIAEARENNRVESPYDRITPRGEATIETWPVGAQVEMHDGTAWRSMGITPLADPLVLESNGRGYLIRLRKDGYRTAEYQIGLSPNQRKQTFSFELVESVEGGGGQNEVSKVYSQDFPVAAKEKNRVANQNLWYQRVPHGKATVVTNPAKAIIELYRDGYWQVVGTSGESSHIVLEATGRHYRIRISKTGYLPIEQWIYLTGSQPEKTFSYTMTKDLAGSPETQYELYGALR